LKYIELILNKLTAVIG